MRSHLSKCLRCIALAACLAPVAAHPQSLGDIFKTITQARGSDTLGAIASFGDILQGQLAPGARAQDADGKVVLYRTTWCGYCKRAAAYMQRKNIPFVERDIEANSNYRAEYAKLGGKGVPLIVAGEKTMSGFSEQAFETTFAGVLNAPAAAPPAQGNELAKGIQPGQAMAGKISGIKVYAQPSKASAAVLVLGKNDEVIYMGEERGGLYRVTTQRGEGWVDKLLVKTL